MGRCPQNRYERFSPTEKGYAFRFWKKAGQKLLRVTAEILIIIPNEVSLKVFCPLFFKKVAVSKGGAFGGIFKGKALESLKGCTL